MHKNKTTIYKQKQSKLLIFKYNKLLLSTKLMYLIPHKHANAYPTLRTCWQIQPCCCGPLKTPAFSHPKTMQNIQPWKGTTITKHNKLENKKMGKSTLVVKRAITRRKASIGNLAEPHHISFPLQLLKAMKKHFMKKRHPQRGLPKHLTSSLPAP